MLTIALATGNPSKFKEMATILSPIHCVAQNALGIESKEETGATFIENALIKARQASLLSGLPALADDSGLVVPALNGKPGIYSARFAGSLANDEQNIEKLLIELAGKKKLQRHAFFYCAIAYLEHAQSPTPLIATGRLNGVITTEKQGHNGFGYDPVFYLPSHQCTMAELGFEVKNQISHRAQALALIRQQLGFA